MTAKMAQNAAIVPCCGTLTAPNDYPLNKVRTKNDIFIKVLSLGIGLAVGIVLIAKVFFELSYDSFYKDIDRVYCIRTWYSQHGDEHDYGQVSGAVSVGFMEEVPGVEVGTRTTYVFNGDTYLDEDGNKLKATLVCADTCFFKVFDRPILAGNPVKILGKWGGVMVSRSFAEKILRSAQDDISRRTAPWTMISCWPSRPTANRARITGLATTGTRAM